MRLAQLTGLEHRKLLEELKGLHRKINQLTELVDNESARRTFLREEIQELSDQLSARARVLRFEIEALSEQVADRAKSLRPTQVW